VTRADAPASPTRRGLARAAPSASEAPGDPEAPPATSAEADGAGGQREEREEREQRWHVAARRARRAGPHGRGGGAWRDAARRDLIEGNSGGAEKNVFPDQMGRTRGCSRRVPKHPRVRHARGLGFGESRCATSTARRACASRFPRRATETRRLETATRLHSSAHVAGTSPASREPLFRTRARDRSRPSRARRDRPEPRRASVSSPSRPRIVVLTAPTRLARPQTHAPIAFRATESQSWPRCCRPAPRSRPARVS
jgi:hypothetical protein